MTRTPIMEMLSLLLKASPTAMFRGSVLSVMVLMMGVALLGLSGWFITATGVAGLAGIGIAFDIFAPSAGVRLLAIGRTAARYGERVLTHDATLRALAALRVDLLRRHAKQGAASLARLRSESALTRIIADVDVLDGLVLRVFLPILAAVLTHVAAFVALGLLAGWPVAWALAAGYVPASLFVLIRLGLKSRAPSDEGELLLQALRRGTIDMLRDRPALALAGQLPARQDRLRRIDAQARTAAATLDRADRRAGLMLQLAVALATALTLIAGAWIWQQGLASASAAAIGIFVAMALGESVHPLRRGMTELGRMRGAADRITADSQAEPPVAAGHGTADDAAPLLALSASAGLPALELRAGEAAALVAPSGAGKTTLLLEIAALRSAGPGAGAGITIMGLTPEEWNEADLRDIMAMVPQRSALLAGTIRDNLSLAAPRASDGEMWDALRAAALDRAIIEKGGLEARLGEGGSGLSGGQARRFAIARAILKQPRLLILDEPTEGLDAETAEALLSGLRAALPEAAILAALHRHNDHPIFGRQIKMGLRPVTWSQSENTSEWCRTTSRCATANLD